METKFQTSFIPKRVAQTDERKSTMSLFLLISIIIFLVSLGVGVFVYLQKQVLVTSITSEQDVIKKNISSFEPATIESVVELNSRITIANTLLKNHVAVSQIFDFLQQRTLKDVRFRNFNFTQSASKSSGGSGVVITMAGQSKDWSTLASQADEFGKADWKKVIQEPKVSNFNLNADGSVSFTFSAFVAPEFLIYENSSSGSLQ